MSAEAAARMKYIDTDDTGKIIDEFKGRAKRNLEDYKVELEDSRELYRNLVNSTALTLMAIEIYNLRNPELPL